MTCTVVQEWEQPRLYDVVSRNARTGSAFAVLDPTWPQPFQAMATGQVEAAVSSGMVGRGDMVLFSSGSTGQPRGIVRRVESWQASVAALSEITGITGDDRVWLSGPLWSSLFLYGAFHAAAVGAHLVFRDDDPSGATALHCVPSQLPGLLQRAEAGGLPHLRVAVVAGDHCSIALRQQCESVGWHVVEYYGAAELSFVAWRENSGPFRAFPGVEIELRKGELWARSPYLARGYLEADVPADLTVDEATPSLGLVERHGTIPRFAGSAFRLDSDGWATVSDLARAIPGGLEVLGRGTSAVNTGGHTVVVEEVERLLKELPDVDDVAVLGVPHPRLGQVLTALVVGSAADGALRAAAARMPAPSRPRRWLHTDALPRTAGGKLLRDALPGLVAKLNQPLSEVVEKVSQP